MSRFVRTLSARSISAVGSLAIVLALAHFYGAEALGVFAVVHAFFVAGSLIATWGAGSALMKFVGANAESNATYRIIAFAIKRTLLVGMLVAISVLLAAGFLAESFGMPELEYILMSVSLAIPLMGGVRLLSGIYKGLGNSDVGCLMDNGGILLLMSALLSVVVWGDYFDFEIALSISYVAAVSVFLFCGTLGLLDYWKRGRVALAVKVRSQDAGALRDIQHYKEVAKNFLYINVSSLLMHSGFFVLAGLYLSKQDVGLLKAAQQVAVGVEFIQMVLNAIYPPKFAKAWFRNDLFELRSLAQRCFVFGFWGGLPVYLVTVIWSSEILGLLSDAFVSGGIVLVIVATGQIVNVLTGPSSQLLGMTDYSSIMRNISVLSYVFSFIVMVPLVSFFSVLGGGVALLIFLTLPNIIALQQTKKLLKIFVIPSFSGFLSISKGCVDSLRVKVNL